jgi:hypothetical protein
MRRMSSTRDHAQPGYEENEDSKGNVAAGRLVHDTQAYLTAEQKRRRRKDAVVAATTVVAYLLLSVGYYCPTQDWSVVDGVYFAFVTITTVGYGDLNGGSDSRTMLFTIFFVLLGVSMIGVAIAEIVEEFRVLQAVAKRKMIERVAADLLAGKAKSASTVRPSLLNRLRGWLVASPVKRLIGMSIRVVCVGLVSMVLLVATEEPDSDIMQSSHPFITSFYVGIITGLTIGYGDFSPSSQGARILFVLYIPAAVVLMLQALDEVNEIVRLLRTSTVVEVVDIREIMKIDTSGEGQIDMNEVNVPG